MTQVTALRWWRMGQEENEPIIRTRSRGQDL